MGKLSNDKYERFAQAYLISLNKTEAARKAGYSEKTAKEQGYRLFTNVHVEARIAELQKERLERIELTQDEVLIELKNFAFSDITETLTLTVEQIKELPPEVRRLITQYKKVTRKILGDGTDGTLVEETIELKFIDKMKAFEMLNRHIGFYEKDHEQGNKIIITPEEREGRIAALQAKANNAK